MTPLMVGMEGVARLTGQPMRSVRYWRTQEMVEAYTRQLPAEDVTAGRKPLWYTATVLGWAVAEGLVPGDHGLPVPAPCPVWHYRQIAEACGVAADTVRIRWRASSVQARRTGGTPGRWLPVEDILVEGTPLWFPETVRTWCRQTGRRVAVAPVPA